MTGKLKHFFLSNAGLWLVFISWALFISNFWLPRNWGFYGTDDWDLTYSTFEVARKSIVEYGQWPSFNPFCAFGSDLDANPQATHASIFFIPVLLFGTFYGYKVSILAAIIIGCWGAFKIFNSITTDKIVSLCMSLIFCGCAYFSRHIFQAGHSNVLYFYLLPWLVYFLNRLKSQGKFTDFLLPVLILCQTIIGGAPFVFIVCVLLMVLWGIGLLWIEKSGTKPVLLFAWIISLSMGLAFWKIWPVIQFWDHMPRHVIDDIGINILIWLQALCDFESKTLTDHGWHEFSMGYSLILVGITLYYFKHITNGTKWFVLSILVFWLSFGNMPPVINPWYILNHYVPVFTSLRAPFRFGILVVFILSVSFIKSINHLNDKSLLYIILVFTVLTQSLSYNAISKKIAISPRLQYNDQVTTRAEVKPIILGTNELFKQFLYIRQNRLVLNGYEPLYLTKVTDSLEAFVEGGKLQAFTPHRIKIKAIDSQVRINLRYNEHWHLEGMGNIENRNGLINIRNSSGDIDLVYENPYVKQGLVISILSAFLLLATYFFLFRKRKRVSD